MLKIITNWFTSQAYYLVSYSWYEDYEPTLLHGPKVKDWEKFCDDLMPEAVERTLQKTKETIGWPEIIETLIEILQTKGYIKVKPEEACYWGSTIICDDDHEEPDLTPELIEKICKHNDEWEEDVNKRINDRNN